MEGVSKKRAERSPSPPLVLAAGKLGLAFDKTKNFVQNIGWFTEAFNEPFVDTYSRKKLDMIPANLDVQYASDILSKIKVSDCMFHLPNRKKKKYVVKKFFKRVVIHASKDEIDTFMRDDDAKDPPMIMEWFAVTDEAERSLWVPIYLVENERELAMLIFKSEMEVLLRDIDDLVGLVGFKTTFFPKLATLVRGLRVVEGLTDNKRRLPPIVLLGVPGTGKSTLMHCIGQLFWLAGRLPFGHLPRKGAKLEEPWLGKEITQHYLGATTRKVDIAVRDAKGGVFGLDEAHTLCGNEYGKEALKAINAQMTENDDILWIIAGYPKEMQDDFFKNEPGLASRFAGGKQMVLAPYSSVELVEIWKRRLVGQGLKVEVSEETLMLKKFGDAPDWPSNFGNGRAAVAVADKCLDSLVSDAGERNNKSNVVGAANATAGFDEWFANMQKSQNMTRKTSAREELWRFRQSVFFEPGKFLPESIEQIDQLVRKYGREGKLPVVGECSRCNGGLVEAFDELRCVNENCGFVRASTCCGKNVSTEICTRCGREVDELCYINWKKYREFICEELLQTQRETLEQRTQAALEHAMLMEGQRTGVLISGDARVTAVSNWLRNNIEAAILGACHLILRTGRSVPFLRDVHAAFYVVHMGYDLLLNSPAKAQAEQNVPAQADLEEQGGPCHILVPRNSTANRNNPEGRATLCRFLLSECEKAEGFVEAKAFRARFNLWRESNPGELDITALWMGKFIAKKNDTGDRKYNGIKFKRK